MTERLLQYIWGEQHFNSTHLQTISGDPVQIIEPGKWNQNQGPDFLEARIKIGDNIWVGSVELHLREDDWMKHGHSDDDNYRNVVLHVIWKQDIRTKGKVQQEIKLPTVELAPLVPKFLLERYSQWMELSDFIPCRHSITSVHELVWESWKERLLVERMIRKTRRILELLNSNKVHWEETYWWMLARNFGNPVNSAAFEEMARSIPFTLLSKHRQHPVQLEALFLGQAGLLNGRFNDSYAQLLQKEYRYQRNKYQLRPICHPVHFLRMRPGNFPTVRLAQLAMLIHQNKFLFSMARDQPDLKALKDCFDVVANDYWHYHYRLDEESPFTIKRTGVEMINNLLINTVCPMLFAYGQYFDNGSAKQKALNWLLQLPAENNQVIRKFKEHGVQVREAFDSQALLEMKTQYCDARRCLECGIGRKLLTPNSILPNPPSPPHPDGDCVAPGR